MTNIATPEEVAEVTGLAVTTADIALAQSVLETVGDLDLAVGWELTTEPTDQLHILGALMWQIRYLDANPDVLGRASDIAQAAANGASVTYRGDTDAALAPLARRELARLSWRGTSGVSITTLKAAPPYPARGPQPDPWRVM